MVKRSSKIVGADIYENAHVLEDTLLYAIDTARIVIRSVLEGTEEVSALEDLLEEFDDLGI